MHFNESNKYLTPSLNMTWYLVAKPLLAITEIRHFLQLATRFPHISGGILPHSSLQILSKSLRFRGWRLATRTFSSLHRFSMGLRSGDWLGHSRTLLCVFLSHSFFALAVCFGSLSCWNTHFQCPGSDGTWPRPSSLWCSAVVLSP